jgi:hypothetical protein
VNADLFQTASKHLAFGKSEKCMMRGIIIDRFLSAPENDLTWINSVEGLDAVKAVKIVTECLQWWKKILEITTVLKLQNKSNSDEQTKLVN